MINIRKNRKERKKERKTQIKREREPQGRDRKSEGVRGGERASTRNELDRFRPIMHSACYLNAAPSLTISSPSDCACAWRQPEVNDWINCVTGHTSVVQV